MNIPKAKRPRNFKIARDIFGRCIEAGTEAHPKDAGGKAKGGNCSLVACLDNPIAGNVLARIVELIQTFV